MSFRGKLVLFAIFFIVFSHGIEGRTVNREDLILERHLKFLNKPSVKSIQSEDGDTIDCIDIYKQPAFDHPTLKNHTIQMEPSTYPKEISKESSLDAIPQIWQRSGSCPEGTIPIRRTRKQDLLRATSLARFGKKEPHSVVHLNVTTPPLNPPGHYHSIAIETAFRYYGAKAALNVWDPSVEADDFSSANLWIMAGDYTDVNAINVGWIVHPPLFGDHNVRLFGYWTGDGYQKTGCFNLLCPGFVQTSKDIALGASIQPVSKFFGKQYEIDVYVYKDQDTGNWWFQYNGVAVGYWPGSLFPILQYSASTIEWGGEVFTPHAEGPHTTTGMGAGQFPGPYKFSSFIKDMKIIDNSNVLKDPEHIRIYSDQPYCYNINMGGDVPNDAGVFFYYGGPGRGPSCP